MDLESFFLDPVADLASGQCGGTPEHSSCDSPADAGAGPVDVAVDAPPLSSSSQSGGRLLPPPPVHALALLMLAAAFVAALVARRYAAWRSAAARAGRGDAARDVEWLRARLKLESDSDVASSPPHPHSPPSTTISIEELRSVAELLPSTLRYADVRGAWPAFLGRTQRGWAGRVAAAATEATSLLVPPPTYASPPREQADGPEASSPTPTGTSSPPASPRRGKRAGARSRQAQPPVAPLVAVRSLRGEATELFHLLADANAAVSAAVVRSGDAAASAAASREVGGEGGPSAPFLSALRRACDELDAATTRATTAVQAIIAGASIEQALAKANAEAEASASPSQSPSPPPRRPTPPPLFPVPRSLADHAAAVAWALSVVAALDLDAGLPASLPRRKAAGAGAGAGADGAAQSQPPSLSSLLLDRQRDIERAQALERGLTSGAASALALCKTVSALGTSDGDWRAAVEAATALLASGASAVAADPAATTATSAAAAPTESAESKPDSAPLVLLSETALSSGVLASPQSSPAQLQGRVERLFDAAVDHLRAVNGELAACIRAVRADSSARSLLDDNVYRSGLTAQVRAEGLLEQADLLRQRVFDVARLALASAAAAAAAGGASPSNPRLRRGEEPGRLMDVAGGRREEAGTPSSAVVSPLVGWKGAGGDAAALLPFAGSPHDLYIMRAEAHSTALTDRLVNTVAAASDLVRTELRDIDNERSQREHEDRAAAERAAAEAERRALRLRASTWAEEELGRLTAARTAALAGHRVRLLALPVLAASVAGAVVLAHLTAQIEPLVATTASWLLPRCSVFATGAGVEEAGKGAGAGAGNGGGWLSPSLLLPASLLSSAATATCALRWILLALSLAVPLFFMSLVGSLTHPSLPLAALVGSLLVYVRAALWGMTARILPASALLAFAATAWWAMMGVQLRKAHVLPARDVLVERRLAWLDRAMTGGRGALGGGGERVSAAGDEDVQTTGVAAGVVTSEFVGRTFAVFLGLYVGFYVSAGGVRRPGVPDGGGVGASVDGFSLCGGDAGVAASGALSLAAFCAPIDLMLESVQTGLGWAWSLLQLQADWTK
jgi:trimeric autotransporter adhesin